ncbi:polymeric immunoglobulin receptor-like [Clarias gariepinus]
MIRELTIRDNGTYLCGADAQSPKGVYSEVELKVKKGVSGSREVTAYAETRSNIKCTYEDEYKDKIKSFCKIETDQRCSNQIKTNTKRLWAHNGRFSIHDNKSAGFFSVFMRELVTEDTGTYACAVHLPDESEIYTIVKLNVTQALSNKTSISVHVGKDETVSCKYPESYRNNPKFLCKRPEFAACSYNKTVKESMRYINEGRISLYDDRSKQIFNVSFNHVTEQDSGEYWCGAEVNWTSDHGYKVYFKRIILTDGGASKAVTGYLGGGVLIKCEYDIKYIQNEKYFCKDSTLVSSGQIKTEVKNKWVHSGRFSLYDDTKSAEFKVMIRELTIQDNGTYLCGFAAQSPKGVYSQVELKVKKGVSGSREVTAYAETRSNIKCTYEDEYKDKIKSFCKIETDQHCSNKIKTNTKTEWAHDDRFSIHDNKSAGFFSVFMRELVTEDTGTYACAVHLPDESEIYTIVKLNVTEALSNKTSISVHVGKDETVSCKYPESYRNNPKFLCKRPEFAACSYNKTVKESMRYINEGRISLYDDRSEQIFTVSFNYVTEQDSGEYWCGAEVNWTSDHGYKVYFKRIILTVKVFPFVTVITVSLSLLVLLVGISFLIWTLHRRCKLKGHFPSYPDTLFALK